MLDEKEGVCNKCNQVIANPICFNCIEKEIEQWLAEKKPLLVPLLQKVTHIYNKENLISDKGSVTCIICGERMEVCSMCYLEGISKMIRKHDSKLSNELNQALLV